MVKGQISPSVECALLQCCKAWLLSESWCVFLFG